MKHALPLLLVALFSVSCSHARDNSKSAAETIEWLKGNVQAYGGWFIDPEGNAIPGWEVFFKNSGSNPCVLAFLQRWTVADGRTGGFYRVVSSDVEINLADLDPSSTTVARHDKGIYFVRLETSHARPAIRITQYVHAQVKRALSRDQIAKEGISFPKRIGVIFSDGWAVGELRSQRSFDEVAWTFGFQEKERSQRVQSAFQHAIRLCGGKTDPF